MNTTRTRAYAYTAAVMYAAIIGLSFLFVKMTINVAHPMDVLAHRFALSLLVVSIPVVLGWIKSGSHCGIYGESYRSVCSRRFCFLLFRHLGLFHPIHPRRESFRPWPLSSP